MVLLLPSAGKGQESTRRGSRRWRGKGHDWDYLTWKATGQLGLRLEALGRSAKRTTGPSAHSGSLNLTQSSQACKMVWSSRGFTIGCSMPQVKVIISRQGTPWRSAKNGSLSPHKQRVLTEVIEVK